MYTFIIVLISIICLLLTFAILLQSGQGSGLSGIANAGAATQMMGQRRTADFLSKSTSVLGGAFLVLCILANFAIDRGAVGTSTLQQQATGQFQNSDLNLPAQTAAPVPQSNENGSND